MLNRQSKILFSVLLVVSLLLHGLAWWWVDIKELLKPTPLDDSTTVQVTLQQPKEPQAPPEQKKTPEQPKPSPPKEEPKEKEPEEERHLPRHNADTFASSNNTDRTANKIKPDDQVDKDELDAAGDKTKDSKKEELKADKTERAKAQTVVSKDKKEKKPKNTDEKPDIDETNSEKKTKQVYSENQSDELKMKNLYLKRMMKQITDNLIAPRKPVRPGRGAISLVLGNDGYLVDAKITKSSGDFTLDLSVLEAVKRVHRFEVPSSKIIANKYYTELIIRYNETIFDQ